MAAMLMPDGHVDVLTYHLAIPDQVLKVHKMTSEGASVAYGFPLTAEFVYALSLPLGRDELAHWLQAAPFVAAVLLICGWASRRGGSAGAAAAWAAAIAIVTSGTAGQQVTVAKNDLAAAAFAAGGAIATARALEVGGAWMALSALLFGFGCGVKFNGAILAACAFACLLPVRRLRARVPGWLVLAALPAIPWLARSWLWFGDPLWPALSSWLPGAWWRPEDAQSVAIARGHGTLFAAVGALFTDTGAFLWQDLPPVALGLPFLLLNQSAIGPSGRWLLGFSGLSMAACAVMMRSEWTRLAAPALFLLAALTAVGAAAAAAGWRCWARRAATAAAVAACCLPLGYFLGAWVPAIPTAPYLAGRIDRNECRALRLTVLDSAIRKADELPNPGGRMLVMGDIRTFGMPARVFEVRNYGSTWAWEMAKAESTPARIRVRFRQLGVRWIMHNFITEGYPHPIVEPYRWDDRMIAVWRGFVERWLEVAVPAASVDNLNGGFCFWRVRDVPLAKAPSYLPYLPGLDSVYNSFVSRRDVRQWLAIALEANKRVPNVDFVTDRIVQAYYVIQDWPKVWEWVQPSISHGTVDDANWWHAAVVLAVMGRFNDAEKMLTRAEQVKPDVRKPALDLRNRIAEILRKREAAGPAIQGLFPGR
jgi:hypothetical protein